MQRISSVKILAAVGAIAALGLLAYFAAGGLAVQTARYGGPSLSGLSYILARIGESRSGMTAQIESVYARAAEHGNEGALFHLAGRLRERARLDGSYDEAGVWNRSAAEHGDFEAALFMGFLVKERIATDTETADTWFAMAAEEGSVEARYELGNRAEYRGDYETALRWYIEAAEQGNILAKLALSDIYRFGKGVPADMPRAMGYIRDAAAAGSALAQFNYARLLEEGPATAQDMMEAGNQYYAASRQDFRPALARLVEAQDECLEKNGATKTPPKICFLLQHTRNPRVLFALGRLYEAEGATGNNTRQAMHFYEEAAREGHAPSALRLARFYLETDTADKNPVGAYLWSEGLLTSTQALGPDDRKTAAAYREKALKEMSLWRKPFAWAKLPAYRKWLNPVCKRSFAG